MKLRWFGILCYEKIQLFLNASFVQGIGYILTGDIEWEGIQMKWAKRNVDTVGQNNSKKQCDYIMISEPFFDNHAVTPK